MAKGKNKHLRWCRMIIDEFDLSGDSRNLGSLLCSYEGLDMTGWSRGIREYIANGVLDAGITGYQTFLNDAATTGAFTVLKDNGERIISFLIGGGAEPVVGDIAYLLKAQQMMDNASFDTEKAMLSADFLPKDPDSNYPFGVVLHPIASIAVTTTGASVDNGAASAAGAQANLHITVTDGGTWAFALEDSTNGSDWDALASFTLDGTAVGVERLEIAGAISRYARVVATRTGGTLTPVVTFSRNK